MRDNPTGGLKERGQRLQGVVPTKLTLELSADAPVMAGRVVNTTTAVTSPAARDFTIDFLRGISILAVAIGHWLVVVPSYANGTFDGVNALGTVPLMQQLTWIFQVMPLFFIVGGFANGISWRSARQKHTGYHDWLRSRLVRLAKPTAALFAVGAGLGVVLRVVGVDPVLVATLGWLIVVPVWFLAVYVIVVAVAPAMLKLHERFGLAVPIVLAAVAAGVDYVRLATTIQGVEWTNFFWVFLCCQQVGFFWLDGRLDRRAWQPWALFAGALTALYLLTHLGPYPVSLVGVPGEHTANNAPPTITLIALGLAQAGLGLIAKKRLSSWLARPRVAGAVIMLNLNAMTILLWHFTALVVTAVVILPLGIVPVYEAGSGAWWLVRVATVVVQALPLAGLVWLFGRIERRAAVGPRATSVKAIIRQARSKTAPVGRRAVALATARVLASAGLCAVAFSIITVRGLSEPSMPFGLPVPPLTLFAVGVALIGRERRVPV